jgi:hypothetical protein
MIVMLIKEVKDIKHTLSENHAETKALTKQVEIANGRTRVNEKAIGKLETRTTVNATKLSLGGTLIAVVTAGLTTLLK